MHPFAPLAFVAVGLTFASTAPAQPAVFASPAAALAALFPQQTFVEWTSTQGDWNGDGLRDLALIANEQNGPPDRQMEFRLVVLAGRGDGRYTLLSASSRYCKAQKFFNLDAKGPSLYATAVDKAEGDDLGSTTLQFRFNPRRGDFELLGKESVWTAQGRVEGRSSVNYLAGRLVRHERTAGRLKVAEDKRFAVPALPALQGFDCDTYESGGLP
ncbi:hypothetical protein [Acidovorax lacteus]|uniref:VCBS repeat-containing protein n=1 Tax=Acidovorax lacteus TaxID=1924988 RepID=A0ABP8L0Q0_9BURK